MKTPTPQARRFRPGRIIVWLAGGMVAIYLVLLIPGCEPSPPTGAGKTPFAWKRDAFWSQLEREFIQARALGPERLADTVQTRLTEAEQLATRLETKELSPDAPELTEAETKLFELAPLIAVRSDRLTEYIAIAGRIRAAAKRQSQSWNLESETARVRLYRLLFGTRAAIEELMLQAQTNAGLNQVARPEESPSPTPSVESHGTTLHSGDILVSRGGAPTSALIARGNDFPGGFSHVALLHVDEKSGQASVIESHIECGVTVSPFEEYLKVKKLRIMVLRLRDDLPATKADPMLPHKAAGFALQNSRQRHIPYDFALDHRDPEKQFCSEVVSTAYGHENIRLWLSHTFISSPVVSAWLGSVGVRHFETQEPTDLEFDPQLRIVAEWRDPGALFKAHLDDAVIDVMLKAGKPGQGLPYRLWLLPFARISKAYSVALNQFGKVGPIPEGLSAIQALRVDKLRQDHAAIADRLIVSVDQFKREKGYVPPYWELVRLAALAKDDAERRR